MSLTLTQSPPVGQSSTKTWLKDAWHSVSLLGVSDEQGPHLSRKIELTNQLAAIVFSILAFMTAGFLATDAPPATINWFVVLLITIWMVPFLNFLESTKLSRHILSTALPLFSILFVGHIRALYPESVHEASFYIPRYFQIGLSFLPLILFSFNEKKHLFASFGINVLILLFFNQIMGVMNAGMGVAESPVKDPFFISVSSVLGLMVVSTGYFFLSKMNSKYELRIVDLLKQTEQQNESMQAAINYAKNIQQVVLPKQNLLAKLHDRMFVFYKPLHTVSGDFYMVEESKNHIVFSVIDCTGHGVPGAFMSILASSAIQRSLDLVGHAEPNIVLATANKMFHDDLSRSGNSDMQDGMDMVLCSYHKQTGELKFAGANLFVHVISNGQLTEYRTDKGGICMGSPERMFAQNDLKIPKDSLVYISSDGYYDQFGGEKNKKLGRRGYRELLQRIASLPMKNQQTELEEFHANWQGDTFQVDDVCLIGFRT
ncbi:MAG: PP2C family protein-serine/threonine phosphatase [Flavobacteriales bacterium]